MRPFLCLICLFLIGCGQMSPPSTLITQKDLGNHQAVYSQLQADPNFRIPTVSTKHVHLQASFTHAPSVL